MPACVPTIAETPAAVVAETTTPAFRPPREDGMTKPSIGRGTRRGWRGRYGWGLFVVALAAGRFT